MSARPPRVDDLLAHPQASVLRARYGASAVKAAVREALEQARGEWKAGGMLPRPESFLVSAENLLRVSFGTPLRRVVNATGVVLHTNLGRAPLRKAWLYGVADLLSGYVDLEMDVGAKARGHRGARLEASVREWLNTDHAVLAVNNNAAAVLLTLNTLSAGKETLISRGELVEIGGGFRVPEVMAASGAILREVGTTNRTRLGDYRRAAKPGTGMLLKVHPSNYEIVGFTQEVPLADLVALGREMGLPVGYDWGTGLAANPALVGLRGEEDLHSALRADPDVLSFSTDKLYGACQGGLLLVRPDLAEAFRTNPLLRALRVDKVTYALLGTALDAYRRGRASDIPALAMLAASEAALRAKAVRLKRRVEKAAPGFYAIRSVKSEGRAGGGSAPTTALPSPALSIVPNHRPVEELDAFLRSEGTPAILGTLSGGRLLIHLRTLLQGDATAVVARLTAFASALETHRPRARCLVRLTHQEWPKVSITLRNRGNSLNCSTGLSAGSPRGECRLSGDGRLEGGPSGAKPLTMAEILFPGRVTVLAGHFGSGKTEITLAGALALAASGYAVSLLDLDVVKPYFRSRSAKDLLEKSGVDLVAPGGELYSSDLPIICPEVRAHIQDPLRKIVIDAGGNDSGVRALSSIRDALPADPAFLLILNFRRPFTPDVESALTMARDIQAMARLPFTGAVSNTHLMGETTPALVREGHDLSLEACGHLGIPLLAVIAARTLHHRLDGTAFSCPVLAFDPVVKPPFEEKPEARKTGPLFRVG